MYIDKRKTIMKYTDVTSISIALKYKGIDPETLDEIFARMPEHRRAFSKIQFILETVVEAINGEWVADWRDTNQEKWYAYFNITPSGFGFSGAICNYAFTFTCVGSRLVFENKEKAEHTAKFFRKLYEEYYYTYGAMTAQPKDFTAQLIEEISVTDVSENQYKQIAEILKG